MTVLPFEILLGIYLGVLTGIIPAVIAGALGFVFKYFTGVTIPGLGVVVLALAIAGVNGGLMALNDPTILASENRIALLTAIIVVLMLSLYAHAQGDKLGASVPRRVSFRRLRDRTLNADVIELVGGRNQVRITVAGDVADVEGYPPLPSDLRRRIREGEWTFPADVPLSELETRFADRLKSELDLADAIVSLDERAKATVAAAPPMGSTSKRVPEGKRAVSLSALVPTGMTRGESVRIVTPEGAVTGTLIAASSGGAKEEKADASGGDAVATDGGVRADGGDGDGDAATAAPSASLTDGGEGRVTVVVDRSDANALLRVDDAQIVVLSRGTRREFELLSLLRRAGVRFRKVSVRAGGPLDGHTIGEVGVKDAYEVLILAAKHDRWQVAPRGTQKLTAGDELYVIGARDALSRFEEVAA